MNNFPLHINKIIMQDKMWVELKPNIPDHNIIAKAFFKAEKNGVLKFKSSKTHIFFYILNEIYNTIVDKKEADELVVERKIAEKDNESEIELSMVADFTVNTFKIYIRLL